jgi:hypothetical protein
MNLWLELDVQLDSVTQVVRARQLDSVTQLVRARQLDSVTQLVRALHRGPKVAFFAAIIFL